MVFQQFNLWSHMTVLQNVVEAPRHVLRVPKAEAVERAEAVLERVGMHDRKDYYPPTSREASSNVLRSPGRWRWSRRCCSSTSRRRLSTTELVGEVLKVMRSLAEEGRTMLVVTHEMGFAREVSTRVTFLHEGRVEETGQPRQMFEQPASERFRQFLAGTLH